MVFALFSFCTFLVRLSEETETNTNIYYSHYTALFPTIDLYHYDVMGKKEALNEESTSKYACFYAFLYILNMRAQKQACFHVNFPFSAYFYPPLHHNG